MCAGLRVRGRVMDKNTARLAAESDWQEVAWKIVASLRAKSPERDAQLRARLSKNWPHLVEKTWTPFLVNASKAGIADRWKGPNSWQIGLPALMLAVTYVWASEYDASNTDRRPNVMRRQASDLEELDRKISAAISSLVGMLEQRDAIANRGEVSSDWYDPGLNIWQAIKRSAVDFPDWEGVCEYELTAFTRIASETSMPGPELVDVLREMAASDVGQPYTVRAADGVSISLPRGSGHNNPAEWVRRHSAQCDQSFESLILDVEKGECLKWFTAGGLARLRTVIAGLSPDKPQFKQSKVKDQRKIDRKKARSMATDL